MPKPVEARRQKHKCEKCGHDTYGHNQTTCERVQAEDKIKQVKIEMDSRDMARMYVSHACLKKTRVGKQMEKVPVSVNAHNEIHAGWFAPRWAVRIAEIVRLPIGDRRKLIEEYFDGDHEEATRIALAAHKLICDKVA